jgi:hypothetical protein
MADGDPGNGLPDTHAVPIVGVFRGPWETGWPARDGAVLGFDDVYQAFVDAEEFGHLTLVTAEIGMFRDYRQIREFLASCDVVYANCGPWAAILHVVRELENIGVAIIREVQTVGWIGYIWQEEVAGPLERPGDKLVFPSTYARDMWDAAAPNNAESRIFYPMLRGTSGTSGGDPLGTRASGTVGFFSRLSRDKGFAYVPAVIARMRAGGHRVDRVLIAGTQADPQLFAGVSSSLSEMGIDVDYRGGLPNEQTRELMADCDCILFLSVSSIESLGRVIVEASAQQVPVITADFGAACDLVNPEYRIPVKYLAAESITCDVGFPLADLEVPAWVPPTHLTAGACFRQSVVQYQSSTTSAAALLLPAAAEPTSERRPVAFTYSCPIAALDLAHKLVGELETLNAKPIHELLLANAYNPRVNFAAATR